MKEIYRFTVPQAKHKKRLDEFLFDRIGSLSKMRLRNLLLDDQCRVNGIFGKPGVRVQKNDEIEIEIDLSARTSMKPESIPLEILFEDAELIVVNKPAEMLVHPTLGVKSGTLLNALSYHLNESSESGVGSLESETKQSGVGSRESENKDSRLQTPDSRLFTRPGLIHRLDKQTSGLMVIAKSARAHRILSDHFQRKLVEKKYLALVEGVVEPESGVIEATIGQDEKLQMWRVMKNGKAAETRFLVLRRNSGTTLLELEPVTGRTNQLRIHCEHLGHPIVGDVKRGGREFKRLCLHASKITFWHPNGNRRLEFENEMPKEFHLFDAPNSKG